MDKFNKCIDHAISLKQIREAEKSGHPLEVSPMTRKKIIGILPLGESKEHVKAADWTLMQLISGGKNLGDRNLWFSIIWLLVKRKQYPYLNDVEEFTMYCDDPDKIEAVSTMNSIKKRMEEKKGE